MIDHDGRTLNYAEYLTAVDECVALLLKAGVHPGDRILIVAENCFAAAAMIFAASRINACAVPVNARLTAIEIDKVLRHAEPRVIIYTVAASGDAEKHAIAAGAIEHVGSFGKIALAYRGDQIAKNTTADISNYDNSMDRPVDIDVAVILYTTGTTGTPKGVMLTHENILYAAKASGEVRGLTADDHVYGVLPLTHVFGLASVLMASCCYGCTVQMESRFQPEKVLVALQSGVSVFPAVPQMHALLMAHVAKLGSETLDSKTLRYVSSGGAPLDTDWKRSAEAFYGVALQNGYGMTETTAGVCGTKNAIGEADNSTGSPFPRVEVRILRTDDAQPDDPVGEVLTRGPHVMKGYYRDAMETAKVMDDEGFLHTGDLGYLDENGGLHIVGRSKELIIRGGFNVYPPEVEIAFTDHPTVVQCAVIGRQLEGGDEEVIAFVQCKDTEGVDEEILKGFVSERLVAYKRPSRIVIVDALPAAATGKILKHRLLDVFGDRV